MSQVCLFSGEKMHLAGSSKICEAEEYVGEVCLKVITEWSYCTKGIKSTKINASKELQKELEKNIQLLNTFLGLYFMLVIARIIASYVK